MIDSTRPAEARRAARAARTTLISAHRGGCGVEGLAALDSYRRAVELGVDFVEFDVRKTADGAYAIYHDERTPSGRPVAGLSRKELTDELGPDALELGALLDAVAGRVSLHVDLKEVGDELEVLRLVLDRVPASAFVATSLEDVSVGAIKRQLPAVRVGLSLGRDLEGRTAFRKLLVRLGELFPHRRLAACGADFVAVHKRLAELRVLRYCAGRGIPAWVWTVDDERTMKTMLGHPAVTALITNRPDLALRLAARPGLA